MKIKKKIFYIILPLTLCVEPISASLTNELPTVDNNGSHRIALKSNLLYDLALIPNIGVELYVGKGWSVSGNWQYAWWKNNRHHNYWRIYGGEINVRRYVNSHTTQTLSGHHIGAYLQGLTYDFERGGRGYLSKFSYGMGMEYGYSFPISHRFRLDFSIGIGYLGGEYKEYNPIDNHYVWQQTKRRKWFGPTKAEVSLVWFLRNKNCTARKGGVQ